MNPAAILALISDLYAQNVESAARAERAEGRVAALETELAELRPEVASNNGKTGVPKPEDHGSDRATTPLA